MYHALNRGNLRADIFKKKADYAAFERILHEALEIHEKELFCYQLMPNHYFPIQDDEHFFVVCRYVERNSLRAGLVDRAEQ